MDVTIIRKTKSSLLPLFIVALFICIVVVVEWMKKKLPISSLPPWEILPGLFCFCLLIYSVIRFFNRKGKIIISQDGVLVNGYGRVNWDSMDSYGIFDIKDAEGDIEPFLIIRLKNNRDVRHSIVCLDKTGAEIVAIIRRYQDEFDPSMQDHKRSNLTSW